MYSVLLTTHSILRWLVIGAGLLAASRAWRALSSTSAAGTSSAGMVFTVLFDLQVLIGLLLYFLASPITTAALHRFGSAMSNDVLRFWTIEHPFGMLAGFVLAHIARAKSRRARNLAERRRAAIYFSLAILVVIATIPWPFLPYGRPLL
jgi:hypothetical protein